MSSLAKRRHLRQCQTPDPPVAAFGICLAIRSGAFVTFGSHMDHTAPSTQTIAANGITHHVMTAGPRDGPAILLVHGLGWDAGLWTRQSAWLAAAGWRVVAPDLRGMGRTDKPAAPYSVAQYGEDTVALLDALRLDRAVVVGFSLGGMVALTLAAHHPRRVAALAVACASAASSKAGMRATEAMLARAETLGATRFAEEQAEAIFSPAWAEAHRKDVADFIAMRTAMDQEALARAFRASYGVDLRPDLAAISVPCHVILAENDSFVSLATGREIARALGADVTIIEEAGHMASLERPEAFDAALGGFLATLPDSPAASRQPIGAGA